MVSISSISPQPLFLFDTRAYVSKVDLEEEENDFFRSRLVSYDIMTPLWLIRNTHTFYVSFSYICTLFNVFGAISLSLLCTVEDYSCRSHNLPYIGTFFHVFNCYQFSIIIESQMDFVQPLASFNRQVYANAYTDFEFQRCCK